ncbi:hypothetical protein NKR19_g6935 [Coniochaeta hoffmannii]|uniref:Uncharacterized protein n=1 Tax=Coniochaeta hoffmannii TaxID=91930 RepID=A0AA38VNW5_9PEZI|nr:hypothetical protein NKR19_g6935 [Coniochaeta hoffmannii]
MPGDGNSMALNLSHGSIPLETTVSSATETTHLLQHRLRTYTSNTEDDLVPRLWARSNNTTTDLTTRVTNINNLLNTIDDTLRASST